MFCHMKANSQGNLLIGLDSAQNRKLHQKSPRIVSIIEAQLTASANSHWQIPNIRITPDPKRQLIWGMKHSQQKGATLVCRDSPISILLSDWETEAHTVLTRKDPYAVYLYSLLYGVHAASRPLFCSPHPAARMKSRTSIFRNLADWLSLPLSFAIGLLWDINNNNVIFKYIYNTFVESDSSRFILL